MTRELDPQLVEDIAERLWRKAGDRCQQRFGVRGQPPEWNLETPEGKLEFREDAEIAILAADAHRAQAVREAVNRMLWTAPQAAVVAREVAAEINRAEGDITPYAAVLMESEEIARKALRNAKRDLLTLLGAQEGDDA